MNPPTKSYTKKKTR